MSDIPIKQLNKKEVAFYPKTNVAAIVDLNKGIANGVASLDETGKVPSSQLPSYVDDVLERPTKESFPTHGEVSKIYIAMDTNKTYRWAGTSYVEISESIAVGTTTGTAYPGELGAQLAEQVSTLDERIATIEADAFSGDYNDLTNVPDLSDLDEIRSGAALGSTALQSETDPTVPAWAKSENKPVYTAAEVGALPASTVIPSKLSDLTNDAGYLTEHQDISGKVDKIEGKGLSTNDYTNDDKTKLDGIEIGAQANVKPDWEAISGSDAEILNKPDLNDYVKVSNYVSDEEVISASFNDLNTRLNNKQDVISDLSVIRSGAASGATAYQKPSTGIPASDLASSVIPDISGKVDKVTGKGLSTNDYTNEDKTLLNDLEPRVEALEYEHKYYTYHFVSSSSSTNDTTKENAIKGYDVINSWHINSATRPYVGTKDIIFDLYISGTGHPRVRGVSYTFSRQGGDLQLGDTISVIGLDHTDDEGYADVKRKFQLRVVNVTYKGTTKLGVEQDTDFEPIQIIDEVVTPEEKIAWNEALDTIDQLTDRVEELERLVGNLSDQVQQLQNP